MHRFRLTTVILVIIFNLTVSSANSKMSAAFLKMLSAKQSHVSPSFDTSILRDLEPAAQEHPEMEDANQPWLDSEFGAPKESDSYIVGDNEREVKRFHPTAFFGSRGKRLEGHFGEAILKHDPMTSFHSRNEVDDLSVNEEDYDDDVSNPSKRFDPSGFAGSRGKRYLPGLEAFLLSQMYHKWTKQPFLVLS